MKECLLISSCLLGNECKYSGGSNRLDDEALAALKEHWRLIPVCPEAAGGLSTPRPPAERVGERVLNSEGRDVTAEYRTGGEIAVILARRYHCAAALMKEKSPSCGNGKIYDGSFSGTLVEGDGLACEMLKNNSVEIFGESRKDELISSKENKTMEISEILSKCDHTLLKVDCTGSDIRNLCDQAIKYNCASVCIPPCHVAGAKRYVGDRMKICTVIGFPNGYMTTAVKTFEAKDAIANGADEIDMVINLSMVKDSCWELVKKDIMAVRQATEGYILKVIIECCLLTDEEKVKLCEIVSACGADYIKTSTGFSTGGATREDVTLMRASCPESVKVKAAGGISSIEDAEDFINLGADRLGTSRIVKIAVSMENNA